MRSFLRKNSALSSVGIALLLVSAFALVEATQVLPFEGQATPMYGPLSTTSVKAKSSSSKKAKVTQLRKSAHIQSETSHVSSVSSVRSTRSSSPSFLRKVKEKMRRSAR